MEINDIKNVINEVHESIYDWCLSESNNNMSFSDLIRGCNYVICEIDKKIDNLHKNTNENERQRKTTNNYNDETNELTRNS